MSDRTTRKDADNALDTLAHRLGTSIYQWSPDNPRPQLGQMELHHSHNSDRHAYYQINVARLSWMRYNDQGEGSYQPYMMPTRSNSYTLREVVEVCRFMCDMLYILKTDQGRDLTSANDSTD